MPRKKKAFVDKAPAGVNGSLTKTQLARQLGVSRSGLYYQRKMPEKDWRLKQQIETVLHDNPSYGHKRIAPALGRNKKPILRVMKKFGIKPYRRRAKKPRKRRDEGQLPVPYQNLLLQLPLPDKPHLVWVKDFTYLWFRSRFVYLATVMDIFTRLVVGWSLLTSHSVALVKSALIDALETQGRQPVYAHSDQGREYTAKEYLTLVEGLGITVSMSRKASPWENGYQESFYSQFKLDLGDPNRHEALGELTAAVAHQIHYYNNYRIHTELKMPPAEYARRHERSKQVADPVSKEMGT